MHEWRYILNRTSRHRPGPCPPSRDGSAPRPPDAAAAATVGDVVATPRGRSGATRPTGGGSAARTPRRSRGSGGPAAKAWTVRRTYMGEPRARTTVRSVRRGPPVRRQLRRDAADVAEPWCVSRAGGRAATAGGGGGFARTTGEERAAAASGPGERGGRRRPEPVRAARRVRGGRGARTQWRRRPPRAGPLDRDCDGHGRRRGRVHDG